MTAMLAESEVSRILGKSRAAYTEFGKAYPGEAETHQPIHTVYGGAHLYSAQTVAKLSEIANKVFLQYAPDVRTFASLFQINDQRIAQTAYDHLRSKLALQCVQDFRIDFEDGYGHRLDSDEDRDATKAGLEMRAAFGAGQLPPHCGIRIKPLSPASEQRAVRTLDLFLSALFEGTDRRLPPNFVVTLPKVVIAEQVTALAAVLELMEGKLAIAQGSIQMELMCEQPQLLIGHAGECVLPAMVAAAAGRCRAVHFGAYDYTAACGIVGSEQRLDHPACDYARQTMQVALAETGVWLADGATTLLPIAPHRGDKLSAAQMEENQQAMATAWRLHFANVYRALQNGFYQGWDLHPAQIPARYAALYVFFLSALPEMSKRLSSFVEKAAQASLVGSVFDDAATGQGLLNFFLRALSCGAITSAEIAHTGLTLAEMHTGSFAEIVEKRRPR